jgi:DNA gyrase subunit B
VLERVKDIDIVDRTGQSVKLTEARWGRFVRTLHELEGWSARLRSDFGNAAAGFVIAHRLVETEAAVPADVERALAGLDANGFEVALVGCAADAFRVKFIERETSAASHVSVPAELLASPVYANVRRAYVKLAEQIGSPPFTLTLRKKEEIATTFSELRERALELSKEGMQISRFKGLGEMNPEELWDTTMDPARRMLVRVEVEDAATADLIFSTLMGDQVEPRREFIEQNAKDVRFLDV